MVVYSGMIKFVIGLEILFFNEDLSVIGMVVVEDDVFSVVKYVGVIFFKVVNGFLFEMMLVRMYWKIR